jgi:hypothetical protein
LTALVLAVVATAAFLAYHAPKANVTGGSDRAIKSYQTLVSGDYEKWTESRVHPRPCVSIDDAGCPAAARRLTGIFQDWVNDLNRSEPPARFVFVDAQMRRHLAAWISDLNTAAAAQRKQDQGGLAHANQAASNEQGWLEDIVGGILKSQQGTVATYTQAVRFHKQNLELCDACAQLVNQSLVSCDGDQASACLDSIQHASFQVVRFEAAIIQVAAPDSFTTQDVLLQSDLARADTTLMAMTAAVSIDNQAAFDAGRISLQQALAAVELDAADILNA